MRATASVSPPAGYETTIVTGLAGQDWPDATLVESARGAPIARASRRVNLMSKGPWLVAFCWRRDVAGATIEWMAFGRRHQFARGSGLWVESPIQPSAAMHRF